MPEIEHLLDTATRVYAGNGVAVFQLGYKSAAELEFCFSLPGQLLGANLLYETFFNRIDASIRHGRIAGRILPEVHTPRRLEIRDGSTLVVHAPATPEAAQLRPIFIRYANATRDIDPHDFLHGKEPEPGYPFGYYFARQCRDLSDRQSTAPAEHLVLNAAAELVSELTELDYAWRTARQWNRHG